MTGIVQNGPVFKARRNRGLPVSDWVPVVHEKHNFNLGVEQKKKGRHKTNRTKNTKHESIPHKLPSPVQGPQGDLKKKNPSTWFK